MIESCRKGDRAAYAGLVREHSGRIFAICLSMLGARHDAEDVAQQTLLRGYMQIDSLCRLRQRFYHRPILVLANPTIDQTAG